jgi:hypothetical protein
MSESAASGGAALRARHLAPSRALCVAWALAMSPMGASAANADIVVTVDPVPVAVSVSRDGLPTYAAYRVSIENRAGNVSNQVMFGGSTAVAGATQLATYVESIPGNACTAGATSNAVSCNIGQLRATGSPGSVAAFTVLFKAPPAGTQITFNWNGTYSNGNSPNAPPSGFETFSGATLTTLTTTDDPTIRSELKTYIPSFGATFFTGNQATATLADTSTTKLTLPGQGGLTTAAIAEQVDIGGLTNDTLTTNTTTITIPAGAFFAQAATIELRRDSSTIRSFNSFDRAPLFYTATAGEPNPTLVNWPIPLCSQAAVQPAPNATIPVCVVSRTGITKKTIPAPSADDLGDWVFVLKALQNGVSRW